ncbi:TlyA family RNA methyltransferase [Lacibacterium aquatile]|uniref:TlyA family RNA methyltransferase n=1 Tax=Lacibacterium aquatile TaxID=1168082 RepID=A0ABW5DTC7_9PROT
MRLDQYLVAEGLALSRERAKQMIVDGKVSVEGVVVKKPGVEVEEGATVTLSEPDFPWVSRGALKLLGALESFGINPAGRVCVDIGASTGGFTEVLLAKGATRVYAVDVGHDQLASPLRDDPRVVNLEGVNARHLDGEVPEAPDWIVCDASFISTTLVLPPVMALAKPGAVLLSLIKPQFEVGRKNIGKGGIVRDLAQHQVAKDRVTDFLTAEGWSVEGLADSPIQGPDGNHEFLVYAVKPIS